MCLSHAWRAPAHLHICVLMCGVNWARQLSHLLLFVPLVFVSRFGIIAIATWGIEVKHLLLQCRAVVVMMQGNCCHDAGQLMS